MALLFKEWFPRAQCFLVSVLLALSCTNVRLLQYSVAWMLGSWYIYVLSPIVICSVGCVDNALYDDDQASVN
uniref:Uncharacterized protein n=1 Tax=Arundo donax TaxID=35708 RepID=A0A0A9H7X0_ARUDO